MPNHLAGEIRRIGLRVTVEAFRAAQDFRFAVAIHIALIKCAWCYTTCIGHQLHIVFIDVAVAIQIDN